MKMPPHPPRPRLSLSVGITGHRPNGSGCEDGLTEGDLRALSPEMIAQKLETVFQTLSSALDQTASGEVLASFFSSSSPRLTLTTCLAEGADRIAVDKAEAAGFGIEAVLPMPVADYIETFSSDVARETFRDYLAKLDPDRKEPSGPETAPSLPLILPGYPDDPARAYELAGHVMLDHVSLLIAVWDGEAGRGRGGTAENIAEAVRRRIPVIWINASDPEAEPALHWNEFASPPNRTNSFFDLPKKPLQTGLPFVLDRLVHPPRGGGKSGKPDRSESLPKQGDLKAYYDATEPLWNFRPEWPLLQAVFCVRLPRLTDLRPTPVAQLARRGRETIQVQSDLMTSAFGWADSLATYNAQLFRSAFVANFIFAALAVFMVALSILLKDGLHLMEQKWPFVLAEVFLIGIVLANTIIGRGRDWHRRWLEAREIAELLRLSMVLRRLGTRLALATGQAPTWPLWYARAIGRQEGVPSADLAQDGLTGQRAELRRVLEQQADYHEKTQKRMHLLEHRMERTGELLFFFIFVIAFLYVLAEGALGVKFDALLKYSVTALTVGVPVLATAIYGIRIIGDFEGGAKRSERMAVRLLQLVSALDEDEANAPRDLALLQSRGHQAADIMLGDIETWRTSAESRRLQLPG